MQAVTVALSLAFFLGLIYRSASLYHPQRRAMLHVKNQRGGKLKEKKTASKPPRQPWVDLSPLGSRPVRMLMLAAGAAGFGLYTPAFYIVSTLITLPSNCLQAGSCSWLSELRSLILQRFSAVYRLAIVFERLQFCQCITLLYETSDFSLFSNSTRKETIAIITSRNILIYLSLRWIVRFF